MTAAILELGAAPVLVSVPAKQVYVEPGGLTARERLIRSLPVTAVSVAVAVVTVAVVRVCWSRVR